jgi:carbamoyltransferase
MKLLGVHDGHNSSACLLEDGIVTWAIQRERMTNRKNDSGMPEEPIAEILRHVTGELDGVALATYFIHERDWFTDQLFWKEKTRKDAIINGFMWPFRKRFDPYFTNRKRDRQRFLGKVLERHGFSGWDETNIKVVEHHMAHAASAFYGSHYEPEEQVLILTADGSGDGLSATASLGTMSGEILRMDDYTATRDGSIGEIYSLVTYYLGLRPWNDEFKVMGMAPYSRPHAEIMKCLQRMIKLRNGRFEAGNVSAKFAYGDLMKLLHRRRFDHICASVQFWFQKMMGLWVKYLLEAGYPGKIAASGGCLMNVKANSLISRMEGVEDLFIFPSAGDESTSIGAAMKVYADWCLERGLQPKKQIQPIGPLYLGPHASGDGLEDKVRGLGEDWSVHREQNVEKLVAQALDNGEIVARCSGRLEFGARALGNRTIMADARQLDIKVPLNSRIKHRDFWMPFAPSVSWEKRNELIENPKDIKAPYMILAFPSTEMGREELKAAMHPYDFSIRPQIVEKDWNPSYWRVLHEWYKQSGCGGFLNTSFNLHGYPIVKDEMLALWTMKESDLNMLVVDNWVVIK